MKKVAVLVAWFLMAVMFIAILNVSSVEAKSLKKGEKFEYKYISTAGDAFGAALDAARNSAIQVVSSDEVEIEEGSNISLGKYTIDGDRVRIVVGGGTTVRYYKITSDGLVEEKSGRVFYSKERLAADAAIKRGNAYAKKGQYDRAIEDFSKAISLKPDFARAYYARGGVYDMNLELDRAIEDYNKAISLMPNYARAYWSRGNAYQRKDENNKAIADYKRSCELGDNHGCSWLKDMQAGKRLGD